MSDTWRIIRSSAVISARSAFTAVPPSVWFVKILLISFFTMYFFVLLAGHVGGEEAVSYVAIGNAVQTVAAVSLYSIANIPGDQKHVGTMQTIALSPAPTFTVFIGMSLFSMLSGAVSVAASLGYAAMFGVDLSMLNVPSMIVIMIFTAVSMSCVGFAVGSVGLYMRTSVILANIMAYIGMVISGVNFPVSQLPGAVQVLSYLYPLTYAVEATRMAVDGASVTAMGPQICAMAILATVYGIVSYMLFRYLERLSRRGGRMDVF